MKVRAGIWSLVLSAAIGFGCGGGDKPVEKPAVTDDEPVEEEKDDYMVSQEALDTINAFLERQRKFVARCWVDAIEAKEVPDEDAGKITIDFTIATDGTVGGVKVTDASHRSKTLERCVIDKTANWKITSLEEPLAYSYTFGFQRL